MDDILKRLIFSCWLFLLCPALLHAANYPLEIINVEETGENNRIRFAYPGIEYKVRTFAHGGAYPFVWSLTGNTTCGATINHANGEITWSNPQVSDTGCTVEVMVTDSESTTDTESYTITVTDSTERFIWMAASNEQSGRDGSVTNPYRNFSDFWSSGGHGGKIMYLRAGTYDFSGVDGVNSRGRGAYRVEHDLSKHPRALLAYPGESPVWSGTRGFVGTYTGKHFSGGGPDMYFYGIRFTNTYIHAYEMMGGTDYAVWHNNVFDDYRSQDPQYTVQNHGLVYWFGGDSSDNTGIGGNEFDGTGSGPHGQALHYYNVSYHVIENNKLLNFYNPPLYFKDSNHYMAARGNVFAGGRGILVQGYGTGSDDIEISYNYISGIDAEDVVWYNGTSPNVGYLTSHFYRNTVVGSFRFTDADAANGPVYIRDNVVINNDNHGLTTPNIRENVGEHYSIVAETAVTTGLLSGSVSDMVDGNGRLTAPYRDYVGSRGWQFADGTTPMVLGGQARRFSLDGRPIKLAEPGP